MEKRNNGCGRGLTLSCGDNPYERYASQPPPEDRARLTNNRKLCVCVSGRVCVFLSLRDGLRPKRGCSLAMQGVNPQASEGD